MLVVVEHRNLHARAQRALDVKTIRCLDVLEIDAAEGGLEGGNHVDQLVEVPLVHLQIEDVDAGEFLEQHALAFHDRLGRKRADVAQAQHGGPVRDHRDEVAPGGVAKSVHRIGGDFLARRGHARRVGQGQIALIDQLLGRRDRNLARGREFVILERGTVQFGALLLIGGHVACLPELLWIENGARPSPRRH